MLTGLAAGILYAVILRDHFAAGSVGLWIGLLAGASVLRLAIFAGYHFTRPAPPAMMNWVRASAVAAALNGLVWGLAAIWFHPKSAAGDLYYLQAFILAAVPAGAIGSLSAYWPAFAAYVTSGLLPFAAYLLHLGGSTYEVLAYGTLFYLALLLVVARNYEGTLIEALRRRVEVDQLAAQLKVAATLAESANRTKSQFLANMSHEIRTPMNAVLGLSELLLDSGIAGVQRERAQDIRRSAQALLGVINDVLDVSRIEAGHLELASARYQAAKRRHFRLTRGLRTWLPVEADRPLDPAIIRITPFVGRKGGLELSRVPIGASAGRLSGSPPSRQKRLTPWTFHPVHAGYLP